MNDSGSNGLDHPVLEELRSGMATAEMKLALAKGALPLEADIMATALSLLAADDDPDVRSAVFDTLGSIPKELLVGMAADRAAVPEFLDALAKRFYADAGLLEKIILNRATPDETMEFLAGVAPPDILERIAINQERLLRHPTILTQLLDNVQLSQATRTRLKAYKDEISEQVHAAEELKREKARLQLESIRAEARARESLEPEAPEEPAAPTQAAAPAVAKPAPAAPATPVVTAPVGVEGAEAAPEEPEPDEKITTVQRLRKLSVAEKIQAAMLGSKEERGVLIRDSNKQVAMAVIKSPKLTDSEVDNISRMRNVQEDVLREIGMNRDFTKNYNVIQGLVFNPKTPVGISLGFMNHLRERDLKDLQRSKDVPETLRTSAKRLMAQKEKRKGGGGGKH